MHLYLMHKTYKFIPFVFQSGKLSQLTLPVEDSQVGDTIHMNY